MNANWDVIAIAGEKCWVNIEFAPHFRKRISPPFLRGIGGRNSGTIINHFFNFLRTHQHATAHSSNGAARELLHNISACAGGCPAISSGENVNARYMHSGVLCARHAANKGGVSRCTLLSGGPQNWKDSKTGCAWGIVALAARSSSLAGGWGWIETMYAYGT